MNPHSTGRRAAALSIRTAALLVAALVVAGCGDDDGLKPGVDPSVTLSPASTVVGPGHQVSFTAAVTGLDDDTVTWYVNNAHGGDAVYGTITDEGVYSAPLLIPQEPVVAVKAVSVADTNYYGTASLRIVTSVVVEMEGFDDELTIDTGLPVSRVSCSAASGKMAVEGLDQLGDAITCEISFDQAGYYSGTLRAQAATGARPSFRITIEPSGLLSQDQVAEFTILGRGVG